MKTLYKRLLIGLGVIAYVVGNYFGGAYIFNQVVASPRFLLKN